MEHHQRHMATQGVKSHTKGLSASKHGDSLNDFSEPIHLHGEPTATHFTCDATMTIEVCDVNPEHKYLPAYFTKRGLMLSMGMWNCCIY